MKTVVWLVMSACLLLGSGVSAQRPGKLPPMMGTPEFPRGNSCVGQGTTCLWGSAGGCWVYCDPPTTAVCEGGYCGWFGFPHPATCRCAGGAG